MLTDYTILRIPENSDIKTIKNAYRKKCKLWHPDNCKHKDKDLCKEKMQEINIAYKIITKFCDNYKIDFEEKKDSQNLDPEEWWANRFGDYSVWGTTKK